EEIEENEVGIACVGVALTREEGHSVAVSITGPLERMGTRRRAELAQLLREELSGLSPAEFTLSVPSQESPAIVHTPAPSRPTHTAAPMTRTGGRANGCPPTREDSRPMPCVVAVSTAAGTAAALMPTATAAARDPAATSRADRTASSSRPAITGTTTPPWNSIDHSWRPIEIRRSEGLPTPISTAAAALSTT